jgi:hypothetical protein
MADFDLEITTEDKMHGWMRWMKSHMMATLIIALVTVVVIVGLVKLLTSGMAQVNISDAEGRNVGVGTPLDFDVIRPEG